MFNLGRNKLALENRNPSIVKPKFIFAAIAAVVASLILLWLFDKVFLYFYAKSYVEVISAAVGLNKHLANILVWVVFALATIFIGLTLSFSKSRRRLGLAGLFLLLVAQPAALFILDKPFDQQGTAQKCYVITRDSIKYGERVGRDPSTGLECKPVTPEIVEMLDAYSKGKRPTKISSIETPTFFSKQTGNPVIWYTRDKNGIVEAFDLMGFNPDTGEELQPVTKEIAAIWKDQSRAPEQIYPDENFAFFDPVSGRPVAWYRREGTGEFRFYNRAGFNPRTGEPLLPVGSDVITEWKKYTEATRAKRCYVLTKNSVKYGTGPGIDTETGRPCRAFTAEMLERLREYEKGNRPKKIEVADPTFFDLRSGEPAIWYAKSKDGKIDLFSLMGFHPDTGEELLPITREVAALWKDQQAKNNVRVPQPVDPKTYVFFDQKTGDSRAWFWRSPDGQYEFYDGAGFHPKTGDKLLVLTKDIVLKLGKDAADKAESDKSEADRRRAELDRASQAGRQCDDLAANPNDANRVGDGMPYESLKARAKEATDACGIAVTQNPNEKRFQYQLGRILEYSDRKRSAVIFQKLVAAGYPAAFDNLGWIAYADQKNPQAAVDLFRRGIALNDTDSMISLAEMIARGHTQARDPSETKLALYAKASQLGNQVASHAYDVEQQKENSAVSEREQQLQQQRIAGQIFGLILSNMAHR
jgi:hypothetical protein